MMKNKLTQTEKNMIENQKQIIDAFEKSGNADRLRSFAEIWTPEKIKEHEDWQKNIRPKWKANKKIQKLLEDYLNSPPDGRQHNDILAEIEKISHSARKKKRTNKKIADGSGISYQKKQLRIDALDMYEKLVANKVSKPTAKLRILNKFKKHGWTSLGTLEKYLTYARNLRKIK